MQLQPRLARLDSVNGLEVAFVCNRIDQVKKRERILNSFRQDIKVYFSRFRIEFLVPFNACGALLEKYAITIVLG